MGLDGQFAEGQTQSGVGSMPQFLALYLTELLEQEGDRAPRDAFAVVLNVYLNGVGILCGTYGDVPAGIGVLDGVGDQIGEDAAQDIPICVQSGKVGRDDDLQMLVSAHDGR